MAKKKPEPTYRNEIIIKTSYRVFECINGHLIEPTEAGYGGQENMFHDYPSVEAFQVALTAVDPEREQLGLDPRVTNRQFVLLPVVVRSVERKLVEQK